MNEITKRVPRNPDDAMAAAGILTLREMGIEGESIELYRIAASVFYAMTSAAPVDDLEDAIERHWQQQQEKAA